MVDIALERQVRGMTQAELAKKAGLSRSYIAMLESGARSSMSVKTAKKLAKVLDIFWGEFFN